MWRTGTPGTSVFSQSAHALHARLFGERRGRRGSAPSCWPAATTSRAYSTDSHSRTSPATMASTVGQHLRATPGSASSRAAGRCGARSSSGRRRRGCRRWRCRFFAIAATSASTVSAGTSYRRGSPATWCVVQPIACARPDRERIGLAQPPVIAQPDDDQLVLIDERVLGGEHGIGGGGGVAAAAGAPHCREDRRPGRAAPAASAHPPWRRTSAGW